jgi:glycosyltransferase involved in cell wall biosynthesis
MNVVQQTSTQTPEISVVIPCYNAQKQIQKAILSVFDSELSAAVEVIVVDDCSTDQSVAAVQELMPRFAQLYLLSQSENKGAGVCRNIGMAKASGRYLAFLDADDYYLRGAVAELVTEARQTDAEVVLFKYKVADENGLFSNTLLAKDDIAWKRYAYHQQQVQSLSQAPYLLGLAGYPWNKLIKNSYAKKIKLQFSSTYVLNDVYAHWCALLSSERIAVLDKPLICHLYERNRVQLTNLKGDRKIASLLVLDEVRALFERDPALRCYLHWFYSFEDDLLDWMYRTATLDNKHQLAEIYFRCRSQRMAVPLTDPLIQGKKLMIYGLGLKTMNYLPHLEKANEVIGFMDSELSRAGQLFAGRPVYHPAQTDLPLYDYLLICSSFEDEIAKTLEHFQLQNYLSADLVCIC